MSRIRYDDGNMIIGLDGLDSVERALGDLKRKTPAAAKVAINATARQGRKLMIAKAKARYAVNEKGLKHIKVLKQRQKATNSNLSASLYIETPKSDLGYFKHSPKVPIMGRRVFTDAPDYFKAKVLNASSMENLSGENGKTSKGFLVKFKSGHIGMVQRVIGSNTNKAKSTRWKTKDGRVEKLRTMGSPSATSMHRKIWPEVEPELEIYLQMRLDAQVEKIIAREKAKNKV
ncbi:MAG: hypothetical protein Q4B86_07175 [Eubacteriales bacterium]|nr:hypothetical protein [Eubacteriales bacterium]